MSSIEPKIGLALGGGAAKGYAHIGVLKVLEERNIKIDMIAGTSIGSIVGALYASGISPTMIEKLAYNIQRELWIDLVIPRRGFIAGKKIHEMIKLLTKNKSFEELPIPLAITATDLIKGEEYVFKKGNISDAIRASISIPGIFNPVIDGDKILVDGGVLNNVPVDIVEEMGADYIIAVDLTSQESIRIRSIYDILNRTFEVMGREILKYKMHEPNILVRPNLGKINPSKFNQAEECIEEGTRATLEVIPLIEQQLGR
ncbi:MAG TPA: patatin-like phospholipase family protein [Thermoanaerobacterales bacterium]|nr:patatin-like phospholipase family protein [Thermoanaerobacterales bacterium]